MATKITEEMNIQEDWYKEAREMTLEKLPVFLKKLTEDYCHDYGTICHAAASAAIGAAWAVDKSTSGGITGFQAGAIMWQFIRHWNNSSNKCGMSLVDYDNFLYPQYADRYDKVLGKDVWVNIQEGAKLNIEDADVKYAKYLVSKDQYDADITAFVDKYPDYHDRKDHYDHLVMGTGDEHRAYQEKVDAGFEFAPKEPYKPITEGSPVYKHWQEIVNGVIPFGYTVSED